MTHLFREQLKGWSCGLVDMATACEAILADRSHMGANCSTSDSALFQCTMETTEDSPRA